jgi:hypothetical protein
LTLNNFGRDIIRTRRHRIDLVDQQALAAVPKSCLDFVAAMAPTTSAMKTENEQAIDDWLPITSSRKAKWWYSAFHNVTAMVGAGVLSLPYAMSELGW